MAATTAPMFAEAGMAGETVAALTQGITGKHFEASGHERAP
jgi:hypothetical protein